MLDLLGLKEAQMRRRPEGDAHSPNCNELRRVESKCLSEFARSAGDEEWTSGDVGFDVVGIRDDRRLLPILSARYWATRLQIFPR